MNAVVEYARRVDKLESIMLKMPQADCPVRHIFSPGLYIREVTLPADSYIIGHRQKMPNLTMIIKGSGIYVNPDGSHTEVKAPLTFVAPPGRKLGYVREEVVLANVYATDEQDIDTLESMFLDKSEAFLENSRLLEMDRKLIGHDDDYKAVLSEFGVTEEQARKLSEEESDLIPFPPGAYRVKVGKSAIEGRGLIATAAIRAGEIICPARIGGKRTPAGRYANHAKDANARMSIVGDSIIMVALRDIGGCQGGIDGEEITVNYRQAIATNLESLK